MAGAPRGRGRKSRLNAGSLIPDDVKNDLLHNSRGLPGWALPLARSIASDPTVAVWPEALHRSFSFVFHVSSVSEENTK